MVVIIHIGDITLIIMVVITMVITIIMAIITTTTAIIQDHVVKDMLLQMHWVGTGITTNLIIKHIVVVMCQHRHRLRKMLLQQEHKVQDQHIVRVKEVILQHIRVQK